jgi:hypothetical protein
MARPFGGVRVIRIAGIRAALAPAVSSPLIPVAAADTHSTPFPIFTFSIPPLLPAIGVPELARLRRYSKSFGNNHIGTCIIHGLSGLLIACRQWGLL